MDPYLRSRTSAPAMQIGPEGRYVDPNDALVRNPPRNGVERTPKRVSPRVKSREFRNDDGAIPDPFPFRQKGCLPPETTQFSVRKRLVSRSG
jgi:hypothetical protein